MIVQEIIKKATCNAGRQWVTNENLGTGDAQGDASVRAQGRGGDDVRGGKAGVGNCRAGASMYEASLQQDCVIHTGDLIDKCVTC